MSRCAATALYKPGCAGLISGPGIGFLLLKTLVAVNYDMNDYLPPDTASTFSMEVMQEEFEGGIPNARIMIRDVTVSQAMEWKDTLKAIDGVNEVTWLDDIVDANQELKYREKGRKTAQKSRECKYVANKSHNTLLRCLRQ